MENTLLVLGLKKTKTKQSLTKEPILSGSPVNVKQQG